MNFDLNENQKMFRDMVRDFAAKEIAPLAHQMDVEADMPDELIAKMKDNAGHAFSCYFQQLGADVQAFDMKVLDQVLNVKTGATRYVK